MMNHTFYKKRASSLQTILQSSIHTQTWCPSATLPTVSHHGDDHLYYHRCHIPHPYPLLSDARVTSTRLPISHRRCRVGRCCTYCSSSVFVRGLVCGGRGWGLTSMWKLPGPAVAVMALRRREGLEINFAGNRVCSRDRRS
jgi:hypothetical protein